VLPRPTPLLIPIPSTATISQALELLTANNITSAPVLDIDTGWFYGFVDMFEFLGFLLRCFLLDTTTNTIRTINYESEWEQFARDLTTMQFRGQFYANCNVLLVKDFQKPAEVPFNVSSPLSSLLASFVKSHHAVVKNGINNTIVSRTDIIRYLAKNINHYNPDIRYSSVSQLNLPMARPLLTAPPTMLAIHAFYMMWTLKIPSVGIVDLNNKLAANLSLSDLKGLTQRNFISLMSPVGNFITGVVRNPKLPPISVFPSSTFENCLLLMTSTGVHHLWVVNKDLTPVGVISMGDIINVLDSKVWETLGIASQFQ
jgi:CBS domain-containing protein